MDDGSEIVIYPVIENLNDNRISYNKLDHKNANIARNYGIEKSKGQYIAMLDADDLWLNNHISECLRILQHSDYVDGLYGSLILKDMNRDDERIVHVRALHEEESMIDYLLSTGYGAQTSTLFMTAESAQSVLWNPELNRHQDYDFVVRYSKRYNFIPKTE
ncbi:MAG: glycosyltransferase family 2 protein, partial [Prevotella sp.]|nr:glycosyltransferase family 2 protein [Prevotella sp.]